MIHSNIRWKRKRLNIMKMKCVRISRFGKSDVLKLEKIDRPQPKAQKAHHRYKLMTVHTSTKQLQQIAALIEAGKLLVKMDRTYPLEEASDAHNYLSQSHALGKVVLTVKQ